MTFCVENETDRELPFDKQDAAEKVIAQALVFEQCPYEAEVSVLLTDSEGIHAMNNSSGNRQINRCAFFSKCGL